MFRVENFVIALSCVTPMFLILCVGILVRYSHIIPPDMVQYLSTLSFRALLPLLLFHNLYTSDLSSSLHPRLAIYLPCFVLVWFLLSFLYYRIRIPDPRRRGALIQNAFRSNIAVIGVALAQSMMGDAGAALMAVTIATIVPIFNTLAVVTLEVCRGGSVGAKEIIRKILTNPLILGCAAGILVKALGITLPAPVESAIGSMGNAGSVLTMVALGASFEFSGVGKNARALVGAVSARLVLAPLCAIGAALLLGMRGNDLGIILVCMGAPTASASFPMAIAMDSDAELTGQIVVLTSLLCSFSMFLWIFLLKQAGLL